MKLYTVYFSPTGGTKKVLDELVKEWLINDGVPDESGKTSIELVEIDLSDRPRSGAFLSHATPGREDFCIIAVPSFGGRVPAAALERLTQLKAGHTPAVLGAAYGNRAYDDTLLELQEAVEHSGFCPVAAIAAVTEHSIMHQYGTGRTPGQAELKIRPPDSRTPAPGSRLQQQCSGVCPGAARQPPLPGIQRHSAKAEGQQSLYRLRRLRQSMSRGRDSGQPP
ncbi:MAG: flavodoxin family protein [Eisenbergiella massiliensis]